VVNGGPSDPGDGGLHRYSYQRDDQPVSADLLVREIDLNASWDPNFFIGIVRVPVSSDDQKIIQYSASTAAGASGSATVTLGGGVSVGDGLVVR
jgi:hypothetical protein